MHIRCQPASDFNIQNSELSSSQTRFIIWALWKSISIISFCLYNLSQETQHQSISWSNFDSPVPFNWRRYSTPHISEAQFILVSENKSGISLVLLDLTDDRTVTLIEAKSVLFKTTFKTTTVKIFLLTVICLGSSKYIAVSSVKIVWYDPLQVVLMFVVVEIHATKRSLYIVIKVKIYSIWY